MVDYSKNENDKYFGMEGVFRFKYLLEHLQQCLKLVPQIEIWGSTQEKLLQQCPIS
jgi:hypothetical protein